MLGRILGTSAQASDPKPLALSHIPDMGQRRRSWPGDTAPMCLRQSEPSSHHHRPATIITQAPYDYNIGNSFLIPQLQLENCLVGALKRINKVIR